MGEIHSPAGVLVILAAFSRHGEALDWAREKARGRFGDVALASPRFAFDETDYYRESMGPGLKKQFFAFGLADPAELVEWKLLTGQWESEYAESGSHAQRRPLNLDPGYITEAKLVLASTKDHAHRIYLSRGIFAEVTLYYQDRAWRSREWTFPDYRRADYQEFFSACRALLRRRARGEPA